MMALALLGLWSCGSDGPAEPTTPAPSITTASLPSGVVGEAYSEAIIVEGGNGEYFWEITGGDLPPGLALSVDDLTQDEALITGVPETAGTFPFTVRVEDGHGRADSAQLNITVAEPPQPVFVETRRLPPALAGSIYEVILSAGGGDRAEYEWSVVAGSLPAGLTLTSAGQFEGTPPSPDTATFTVEVASGGFTAQQTFTLAVVQENTGRYDITLFPVVSIPADLEGNVREAIRRWEAAITGDLARVFIPTGQFGFQTGSCGGFGPMANGTSLDDIIVMVNIDSIDGRGKILGQAGPCAVRNSNTTPIIGILTLDRDDLQLLVSEETVTDIIQHEIGHILGFGTLWNSFDLLAGEGTDNPTYVGAEAIAAYQAAGGTADSIPVENQGGEGTRDSHWRESVFDDLLMTGFSEPDGTNMPLSRMTIASFADLGYAVDLTAADTQGLLMAHGAAEGDRFGWSDLGYDVVGVGPIVVFHEDGTRSFLPDP